MMRLAVLAPAIPSVSATFVYREVDALRRHGAWVATHALRTCDDPSAEGARHVEATSCLYSSPGRLLRDAAVGCLSRPFLAIRAAGFAAWDFVAGNYQRFGQRLRVPVQCVAGIALGHRLRQDNVAHLRIHFAHAPATVGMYAAAASGIPFSVVGHARDVLVEGGLLEQKMRRAQAFTTISEANKRELVRRHGGPAWFVQVERCGVDRRRFTGIRSNAIYSEKGTKTLATVARLVPKKGIDLLIQAVALIRASQPDVELVVIGEGPERERLEELRGRLALGDAIHLVGSRDGHAVLELLQRTSVFCLPCREAEDGDRDGIPVALMEAMACGVPVVAGQVPGIEELIVSGQTGVLVQPEDVDSLASALETLLSNPARRVELGQRGSSAIAAEFDMDRNAGRVLHRISSANQVSLANTLPMGKPR